MESILERDWKMGSLPLGRIVSCVAKHHRVFQLFIARRLLAMIVRVDRFTSAGQMMPFPFNQHPWPRDVVRDVGQLFDGLSADLPYDPAPPWGPLLFHDYKPLRSNFPGNPFTPPASVLNFTRRVGIPQLLCYLALSTTCECESDSVVCLLVCVFPREGWTFSEHWLEVTEGTSVEGNHLTAAMLSTSLCSQLC